MKPTMSFRNHCLPGIGFQAQEYVFSPAYSASRNLGGHCTFQPGFQRIPSLLSNLELTPSLPRENNLPLQSRFHQDATESPEAKRIRRYLKPVRAIAPEDSCNSNEVEHPPCSC
ncbi:hypothetical protein VNO77_14580 [Canavalia gladiata]|uniref:Uncharacterized protein n=1 Tax=Canavalia gladiata TaxID=3824 RepID=A0AAN9QNS5_CANGL